MAKLLCFLFLAGIAFQANAVSPTVDPEDTFDWITSIFNPFEWISNIEDIYSYITSCFNPLDMMNNIATLMNPYNWDISISSILNPFDWDFWKPLGHDIAAFILKLFPDDGNLIEPSYWLKRMVDIFNPLPYPWSWLLGVDSEVCNLELDKGPCNGPYVRFYYNKKTHSCERFTYGGCKGNRNNFLSKLDCDKTCVKVLPPVCNLELDKGPCNGPYVRFYYNKKTFSCERFTYGGCKGNQNNFLSKLDCEKTCVKLQ